MAMKSGNGHKGSSAASMAAAFPRSLAYITISVAGLALFLFLASLLLVSSPISSTVQGYFYKVDDRVEVIPPPVVEETQTDSSSDNVDVDATKKSLPAAGSDLEVPIGSETNVQAPVINKERKDESEKKELGPDLGVPVSNKERKVETEKKDPGLDLQVPVTNKERNEGSEKKDLGSNVQVPATKEDRKEETEKNALGRNEEPGKKDGLDSKDVDRKSPAIVDIEVDKGVKAERTNSVPSIANPDVSNAAAQEVMTRSDDLGCDLFKGNWFYDPLGPLYKNNTCPVITQMQNCQGNGRPDHEYENWRWKPSQCDLPRFDARKFLELMRGKTLAFIGDSVARNQMESLMCLLWQVEVPKNRGNKRMHRYYFRSTSTMIVRMWSSWLVHQTPEAIDFAPEGVTKVHLDAPDENFMQFVPTFDVVILSSGHWFAKQSVYVLNNEIIGGQLWWPDQSRIPKINNIEAFGISVETIVASMLTHRNYTGLTIVRSYSPDHYEGGAWNTGGSCTGKTKPVELGKLVNNDYQNVMHEKQVTGFHSGAQKGTNKSKMKLMDVTEMFSYRHDGHPGPYRSPDPNKRTQYGPDGKPPPQDCLHWCMPGPVDTWNELMLEIIRREFESESRKSSRL